MQESYRIILIHDIKDQAISHSFECALKKHHIAVRGHSAAIDDMEHGLNRFAVLILTKNAWFSQIAQHEVALAKQKMDNVIVVDFCKDTGIMPSIKARRIYTECTYPISSKGKSMDTVAIEVWRQIRTLTKQAEAAKRNDLDIPRSSFIWLGTTAAATLLFIATVIHLLSPGETLNGNISMIELPELPTSEGPVHFDNAGHSVAETSASISTDKAHLPTQKEQVVSKSKRRIKVSRTEELEKQDKAQKVLEAALRRAKKTHPGLKNLQPEKLLDNLPETENDQEAIDQILAIVDKAGEDGGDPVMSLEEHPYKKIVEAFKDQKFTSSQTGQSYIQEQIALQKAKKQLKPDQATPEKKSKLPKQTSQPKDVNKQDQTLQNPGEVPEKFQQSTLPIQADSEASKEQMQIDNLIPDDKPMQKKKASSEKAKPQTSKKPMSTDRKKKALENEKPELAQVAIKHRNAVKEKQTNKTNPSLKAESSFLNPWQSTSRQPHPFRNNLLR